MSHEDATGGEHGIGHAHDATLLDSRGYRWAAAAFWIALALGAVAMALRGYLGHALLLAIALVVSVAFALALTRLPRIFDLLFVVGAILNAAGYAWSLFSAPGPWDERRTPRSHRLLIYRCDANVGGDRKPVHSGWSSRQARHGYWPGFCRASRGLMMVR